MFSLLFTEFFNFALFWQQHRKLFVRESLGSMLLAVWDIFWYILCYIVSVGRWIENWRFWSVLNGINPLLGQLFCLKVSHLKSESRTIELLLLSGKNVCREFADFRNADSENLLVLMFRRSVLRRTIKKYKL